MQKYFIITIFAILLILLVLPQVASAGLVPCGRECLDWAISEDGSRYCITPGTEPDGSCIPYEEAQPCSICHFFIGAQKLLNGIGFVIAGWAAVFIVAGGIMILTAGGSPEGATKGKKTITYAIIGVIIAFFAWFIINEVMLLMVGEGTGKKRVMPWPWNKIECATPELPSWSGVCEVEEDGENGEEEEEEEVGKNYCTCVNDVEVPDHRLITATKLSDAETCTQECKIENDATYCAQAGMGNQLACRSEADLSGTSAKCLKEAYNYERRGISCYSTVTECANTIESLTRCQGLPTGEYCMCYNGDTYLGPSPFPCPTNEFAIFLVSRGGYIGVSAENVISCSQKQSPDNENCRLCALGSFVPPSYYCHLQYKDEADVMTMRFNDKALCRQECSNLCDLVIPREDCEDWCCLEENKNGQDNVCQEAPITQWCKRSDPAGSENWVLNPPPGGAKPEQKGDASSQLTNLINCMYGKLPDLKINSISSNALCNDPSCDISQAGICGHTSNSCHFGGTNCTGESYAVDFHANVKCANIKTAAQECDSTAWVNWESSHTHVSVNNTACGCNEPGPGVSCPP